MAFLSWFAAADAAAVLFVRAGVEHRQRDQQQQQLGDGRGRDGRFGAGVGRAHPAAYAHAARNHR